MQWLGGARAAAGGVTWVRVVLSLVTRWAGMEPERTVGHPCVRALPYHAAVCSSSSWLPHTINQEYFLTSKLFASIKYVFLLSRYLSLWPNVNIFWWHFSNLYIYLFFFPTGGIKIILNQHFGMKHFSFWNVSLKRNNSSWDASKQEMPFCHLKSLCFD